MSLCPHCKKTSLELVDKPSKTNEFFSYLWGELMIGLLVIGFIAWNSNKVVAAVLILMPVAVVAYVLFQKKENPLSRCLSCENVFDEETIQKAQRQF